MSASTRHQQIADYGSWTSPITARLAASAMPLIDQPSVDGECVYWLESRPAEGGRNTIMELRGDTKREVLPSAYSARSRVHEYGGACYAVHAGTLYFVNQADQRVYRLNLASEASTAQALTPENQGYRFADFDIDTRRQRLLCICEHHASSPTQTENFIAAISLFEPHQLSKVVSGNDFYAYPRMSPDRQQLCWISWDQPLMPWYGCELWLANLDENGDVATPEKIAGNEDEAIFQPQWSPDGALFFVSDRAQWWNLFRHVSGGEPQAVCPLAAEFATPLWSLGMSTYGICADQQIVCTFSRNGRWELGIIDADSGVLIAVKTPYSQVSAVCGHRDQAVFVGAAADTGNQLARLDVATHRCQTLRDFPLPVATTVLSSPRALTFATSDQQESYAFYYPPHNATYRGPEGQRPPLIVICHGGPTGATSTALNLKTQYWTSRGFAVLDINYRGSTGYGREYRLLLDGKWGVSDVTDVEMGVAHAVNNGLADGDRVAIRGSSAGGYTVLAALVFGDTFKAGSSYYGIGDLETLAHDTHKFEARYLDRLVGPYPRQKTVYQQRSPIHHLDKLNCPVIFFQGLEDKVVPPSQAEAMVAALEQRGLPVHYVAFAGEGHGFRDADNVAKALTKELEFYHQVFSFEPACYT